MSQPQSTELKCVVTNTLIVGDVQRSVAFYRDVLGAKVLREGEPTFLRLDNIWLTVNRGGGPTDDKPEVVAFAAARSKRSKHLSKPSCDGHPAPLRSLVFAGREIHHRALSPCNRLRCYMRDPDGYLIEVGQTTMTAGPLDL
jgi:lactoylglutathione lyase